MATSIFNLDNMNRMEGHQAWEIEIGAGNITTSAKVKGMMFRGWERILEDRDPRDAIIICGRI
jgi:Ni,Fe-hydrogenase I large subunit